MALQEIFGSFNGRADTGPVIATGAGRDFFDPNFSRVMQILSGEVVQAILDSNSTIEPLGTLLVSENLPSTLDLAGLPHALA